MRMDKVLYKGEQKGNFFQNGHSCANYSLMHCWIKWLHPGFTYIGKLMGCSAWNLHKDHDGINNTLWGHESINIK